MQGYITCATPFDDIQMLCLTVGATLVWKKSFNTYGTFEARSPTV